MVYAFSLPGLRLTEAHLFKEFQIPQEEWQSLNDKLDRLAEMIKHHNATDHNTYIRSHRIGEVK